MTVDRGVGPLTVTHAGQLPAVTISFDVAPGVSLGEGMARVEEAAREVLPATLTTSFQGTAQEFQKSARGLGLLLVAAVVVIYLVMGMLYESYVHPVTILSGLPSAGVGALLTLAVFDSELNLYSMVGLIMLRHGFTGRARVWWNVSLGIQVWHHFEHFLLLVQALAGANLLGRPAPTSIIQLLVPRMELHLFYNTLVTIPMVVAMILHRRPSTAERTLMACSCAPALAR